MSYIKDFEAEFAKKLQGSEDSAAIVKWVSAKILESYKNGLAARKSGKGTGESTKAK